MKRIVDVRLSMRLTFDRVDPVLTAAIVVVDDEKAPGDHEQMMSYWMEESCEGLMAGGPRMPTMTPMTMTRIFNHHLEKLNAKIEAFVKEMELVPANLK